MAQTRNFDNEKKQKLSKMDMSRKNSIDAYIISLINLINGCCDYVTTSSCSGRTILFQKDCDVDGKSLKSSCEWKYTSHTDVDAEHLLEALSGCTKNAVMKFEPFIMHVQCRSLASAQTLHECASSCGYRNSGITAGKSGKITLAIRSTQCMEVPLTHEGEVLVSSKYIRHLVSIANDKMAANLTRIDKFYAELSQVIQSFAGHLPSTAHEAEYHTDDADTSNKSHRLDGTLEPTPSEHECNLLHTD